MLKVRINALGSLQASKDEYSHVAGGSGEASQKKEHLNQALQDRLQGYG